MGDIFEGLWSMDRNRGHSTVQSNKQSGNLTIGVGFGMELAYRWRRGSSGGRVAREPWNKLAKKISGQSGPQTSPTLQLSQLCLGLIDRGTDAICERLFRQVKKIQAKPFPCGRIPSLAISHATESWLFLQHPPRHIYYLLVIDVQITHELGQLEPPDRRRVCEYGF